MTNPHFNAVAEAQARRMSQQQDTRALLAAFDRMDAADAFKLAQTAMTRANDRLRVQAHNRAVDSARIGGGMGE